MTIRERLKEAVGQIQTAAGRAAWITRDTQYEDATVYRQALCDILVRSNELLKMLEEGEDGTDRSDESTRTEQEYLERVPKRVSCL